MNSPVPPDRHNRSSSLTPGGSPIPQDEGKRIIRVSSDRDRIDALLKRDIDEARAGLTPRQRAVAVKPPRSRRWLATAALGVSMAALAFVAYLLGAASVR